MITPGVCDLGPLKLHYLEAGVGELVICAHGFPDHAPTLRPMLEALEVAGFRAVAPFMRGYAPTTGEVRSYESAALASDLLGLGNALGAGESLRLVGHDWGGVAALHAAVLQPERVLRLVTLGVPHARAFARALREDPLQLRRSWYEFVFLARGLAERLVADSNFAFLDRLVAEWSPSPPFQPVEWVAIKRTLGAHGVLPAVLEYYRAALGQSERDPALSDAAARWADPVKVPTLAIYGDADGCIGPEVHESQAEHFTAPFRLRAVSGVGHWPHLEAPGEVLPPIVEFLRG